MNVSAPHRFASADSVVELPERIGDLSDTDLLARLGRAGFFGRESDKPHAMALIVLARRLAPAALVMRFAEVLPHPKTAITETETNNALARFGFSYFVLKTTPGNLDERLGPFLVTMPQPCVLFFEDGNLTLVDCTTGEARVVEENDPLRTRLCKIRAYQSGETTGAVEAFGRHRRDDQSWFGHMLSRLRKTILFLGIMGFLLTATAMAVPIIILLMYDQVVGPRSMDAFWSIATGGALIVLSEVTLRTLRARALSWMTARLDYLVGTGLFEKFLTLPPRVAEQVPISSHIARIRTFESVRDFFSGPVLVSALGLPATLLGLMVILLISGPLVLVPVSAIAAYMLMAPVLWRKIRLAIEDAALEGSAAQGFLLETFQKRQSIQGDGLKEKWMEKYREVSGSSTAAQYRLFMLGQTCELIGNLISGLVLLVTLWAGTHMVWSAELSIGALIAVTMLTWNCLYPFHSLLSLLPRFEQSRKCILQIDRFIDSELNEADGSGDVPVPVLRGGVQMTGVAVRYSRNSGPVFAGLNITVRKGEIVAVTGPNGAGKSSLLRLVAGLEHPTLGAIKLDGLNVRQLNARDLRRSIAYIPQNAAIFRGTVADNLRHANRLTEESDLWNALEIVGARQDIEALPDGMYAELAAKGRGLSELLIQRLVLARAVLVKSPLMVIDERPASALRAGLDEDLKRLIDVSRGERTVFVATYRADFMRQADKVISLRPMNPPITGSPDKILEKMN